MKGQHNSEQISDHTPSYDSRKAWTDRGNKALFKNKDFQRDRPNLSLFGKFKKGSSEDGIEILNDGG